MSTRNISLSVVPLILFFIALDSYVFYAYRTSFKKWKNYNLAKYFYFTLIALSYTGLYFLHQNFTNKPLEANLFQNFFIGFFFAFTAFRLVFLLVFLAEDIVRISLLIFHIILNFFNRSDKPKAIPGRRNFIRQSGLIIAAIPFSSMLYGTAKGKYDFKVRKLKLAFENLPKAFDGFKIVQISDIHTGSFGDKEGVLEGINLINKQNADVVLFTGDLVNNDSREVVPFIEDFKKLKAKQGVYSVLGNHDYGDYKHWPSPEEKLENQQLIHKYQQEMNFELLNNENVIFDIDGEQISIIGVENWGHKPFPKLGDLDKAVRGAEDVPFKILMTHDPTHWEDKAVPHQTHFDLTFSGHTHGMQFGIDIPGLKWSPVKFIYPKWAGLYREAKQYLYVNRGFGFIGYPGRAGIRPEITVIELSSSLNPIKEDFSV
ncbi:MAG: metallophosphoesterase [Bacteroidota bacterium]